MGEAQYRVAEKALWDSEGLRPKEHFVDLGTIGTRVRVQEVGEGEPVLFIHGGPNSGSTWAQLVSQLDGFRCLVLDRPGTGLSDDYSLRARDHGSYTSSLVAEVLDAFGIDRSHVVASSLADTAPFWVRWPPRSGSTAWCRWLARPFSPANGFPGS